MEELNRVQIASDLLDEANALSLEYSGDKQIEILYNFLLSNEHDKSGIGESLCRTHGVSNQLLQVYKKDAWLIILLDGYEYLRYIQSKNGIGEGTANILRELENLNCMFSELFDYFMNPENKDKIKLLIAKYYEYIAHSEDYIKLCGDYNYEHQTDYRNILTDYLGNIAVMDQIASIFSLLYEKYQVQINEVIGVPNESDEEMPDDEVDVEELVEDMGYENEADFNEDEYNQAIDELFEGHEEQVEQIMENFKTDLHAQVMDCLENFFDDKFECDDFIGFFMSYVYISLIKNEGRLLKEEEAILNLLKNQEVGYPLIVETFYDNRDYVLSALDVFTEYYYKHTCDILTHRDDLSTFEYDRVSCMDKWFTDRGITTDVKILPNPLYEIYDMIFAKYKVDYPNDYLEKIFNVIMSTTEFEPVFYELGLEGDLMYHRVQMIRYFSRRFLEKIHMQPLNSALEEMDASVYLVRALELADKRERLVKIVNAFKENGIVILKGYEFIMSKTDSELKESIRGYNAQVELKRVFEMDPMVVGDSTYYRAFTDSDLYQYLEKNGIEKTAKYVIDLSQDDYNLAREFINEIIVSIYFNNSENENKDTVEQTITLILEVESSDIESYIKAVLSDYTLLLQLLTKYYDYEKEEDFPVGFEERVVKFPKVKQKLYPNPME